MKMNLFGWTTDFGEAWFQSINPLFILLFAPIVSAIWLKMVKQPSLPVKFGLGTLLAGASYILMGLIGMSYGDTHFSVNWVIYHTLYVWLVNYVYHLLVTVRLLN